MENPVKKNARAILEEYYKVLTKDLSEEEKEKMNEALLDDFQLERELGQEITKAFLSFVCPETGALMTSRGFGAQGNIRTDTKELEIIVTVECSACKKDHPVVVLAIKKLLQMPIIYE